MRKRILFLYIVLILPGITFADGILVEVKGGSFYPSEQAFKDIYGSGTQYGVEVTAGLWKKLDLWVGISYFMRKGKLSFTKEETTVKIVPVGWGLRYRFLTGRFNLYAGGGLSYFQYDESNILGDIDTGAVGYTGRIGGFLRIIKGLILDACIEYSRCTIAPAAFEVNIGGTSASVGLGYQF